MATPAMNEKTIQDELSEIHANLDKIPDDLLHGTTVKDLGNRIVDLAREVDHLVSILGRITGEVEPEDDEDTEPEK